MSHVRAYARLSPEERQTLLTNKGARERLARIGMARCKSCPDLGGLFDLLGIRKSPQRHKRAGTANVPTPEVS
jgi:hypothetical protein